MFKFINVLFSKLVDLSLFLSGNINLTEPNKSSYPLLKPRLLKTVLLEKCNFVENYCFIIEMKLFI